MVISIDTKFGGRIGTVNLQCALSRFRLNFGSLGKGKEEEGWEEGTLIKERFSQTTPRKNLKKW